VEAWLLVTWRIFVHSLSDATQVKLSPRQIRRMLLRSPRRAQIHCYVTHRDKSGDYPAPVYWRGDPNYPPAAITSGPAPASPAPANRRM
jgi:hypothetical protein